jgi:hypothetical protein
LQTQINQILLNWIITNDYCDRAITTVEKLKNNFKDIFTAITTIRRQYAKNPWNYFDLGILYGLTNSRIRAKIFLFILIKQKCQYDYEFERREMAIQVLEWIGNKEIFLQRVKDLIIRTRQKKKLPDATLDKLTHRKTKST